MGQDHEKLPVMYSTGCNKILSCRMNNVFPLDKKYDENDKYIFEKVMPNLYNEKTNPNGVINLGVAWSFICDDIINEKVKEVKLESAAIALPYYGALQFRQAMAKFYSRKFHTKTPMDPENLIITNGLTSTLDLIAHVLADPGEFFCTTTPTYAYFHRNFLLRSGVGLWPIDLFNAKATGVEHQFELTAKKVEDGIESAIKQGKVIRGFVLSNPCNPFGVVYSEKLILEIMNVCAKYKIHIIVDECGHLLVHNNKVTFKSVVAFDHIPDPERTHVLWSATKDLSIAGARISTVYSYSPQVANCFKLLCPFYMTSSFAQTVCQHIVKDPNWVDNVYFKSICSRLNDGRQLIEEKLGKLGVIIHPTEGGLTLMVSLRKFMKSDTFEAEMDLVEKFIKFGVYIYPGQFLFCSQPGWFRIAFAFPKPVLQLGLKRLVDALVNYQESLLRAKM